MCLVEHANGKVIDASLEALSVANEMAQSLATSLEAIFLGSPSAEVAAQMGSLGVETLRGVEISGDAVFAPSAWARAICEIVAESGAEAIIAGATDRGNEVLARAAAALEAPFVANCVSILPGAPYRLSRLRWAGSLIEDSEVDFDGAKLFSIAPNSQDPKADTSRSAAVVKGYAFAANEADLRDAVVETLVPQSDSISLSDSRIVVGGGRGVGSPEGFAALDELALLLGGVVGVSRVVTSVGWRPHRDQIGQTGTKISPDLYIACGISGAIQHMAGCRSAKCILAINTDRDAPIMSSADYVVVGDLLQILPRLVQELKSSPI